MKLTKKTTTAVHRKRIYYRMSRKVVRKNATSRKLTKSQRRMSQQRNAIIQLSSLIIQFNNSIAA